MRKPHSSGNEPREWGLKLDRPRLDARSMEAGKGGTIRTCDMQSQSLLLYQLSYTPSVQACGRNFGRSFNGRSLDMFKSAAGAGARDRTLACRLRSRLLFPSATPAMAVVVPSAGLEPACPWAPGSEPGASANFATRGVIVEDERLPGEGIEPSGPWSRQKTRMLVMALSGRRRCDSENRKSFSASAHGTDACGPPHCGSREACVRACSSMARCLRR